MALTPKQQAFARGVASGLSYADAYREAGYSTANMKPKTVREKASRLMAQDNIRAIVGKVQGNAARGVQVTLEGHLLDLRMIRDAAIAAKQFGPAATAEVARGKVAGFYIDRLEMHRKLTVELLMTIDLSLATESDLAEIRAGKLTDETIARLQGAARAAATQGGG